MPKGPLFTPQEDEQIRSLFAKRISARGMAAILNRPVDSIQSRTRNLGLRRPWGWSPDHDEQLRSLSEAHVPVHEIATILDRTQAAVRKRCMDIGVKHDARKTRLAERYGVGVLANGKDPAVLLAELREAEETKREAEATERSAKIEKLLDEMERGLTAGCDRAFMFTAALVAGATLKGISDRVGITRERVRQVIEARAEKTTDGAQP